LVSGCDVKRIDLGVARQVAQSIRPATAETDDPSLGPQDHEYTFTA
jgi:hypothetical protein